jgi:magnesium transporter
VQATFVADMNRTQLKQFVRRLDPDEATDVLGFADGEARSSVPSSASRWC